MARPVVAGSLVCAEDPEAGFVAGRPDPMPAGGLLVVRPEVSREVLGLWSG